MRIKLEDYDKKIKLYQEYIPEGVPYSQEYLLKTLSQEPSGRSIMNQVEAMRSKPKKREIIKAMLTVRPSGGMRKEIIDQVDSMLQIELKEKSITQSSNIERLRGGKISIWNGDITTLEVDAIVNAANNQMEGCFIPFHKCIDNAIHNAAGVMLREDCGKIMRIQGALENSGNAKITRAYNLPSKYVIHTVGPIVSNNLVTEKNKKELAKCYEACLDIAKDSGLVKSIALCGISTGIYGFPLEKASEIAVKTVEKWLRENPDAIEHVIFNTFGEKPTSIYKRLVKE